MRDANRFERANIARVCHWRAQALVAAELLNEASGVMRDVVCFIDAQSPMTKEVE